VKVIRNKFPKIRTYIRRHKRRYEVDARGYGVGHRFYFTDKRAAFNKAASLASLVRPRNDEPVEVEDCRQFKLDDIVEKIVARLRIPITPSKSPLMGVLVDEWIETRKNDKLKPIRHRSLMTLKFMGSKFKTLFEGGMIHELTATQIESVFSKLEVGPQSLIHYKCYLSQFFNWAIRRGLVDKNPLDRVQVARHTHEVEIYSVDQVKTMLRLVRTRRELNELIPSLVVGLFGGCRPYEIEQMTWEDNFHWDHKEIEIQSAITKTKRPRRFSMEPLLVEWLGWYRGTFKDAKLIPQGYRRRMDKFKKSLSFEWIPDGLRHSFGTYHYNRDKSLGGLTFVMGNSEAVARKHYLTTLPQNEVGEYWTIRPD
jgi:integrase